MFLPEPRPSPPGERVRRSIRLSGNKNPKNRLGINDAARLDEAERFLVAQRVSEGVPTGSFDLAHLQAIHRHLFQDVYDWAGEIRTVEISKGAQRFQFRQYTHAGMADVHRLLVRSRFLGGLSRAEFAKQAAVILGDVNFVHPFREGNGRTQLQYLKLLAIKAGHSLDLSRIDTMRWIEASQTSHAADYDLMAQLVAGAIVE